MGPLGLPVLSVGSGRTQQIIGREANGFAASFLDDSLIVRDASAAANNYTGSFRPKLTVTGALATSGAGAYFDGSNYARILQSAWPNSTSAITIYAEVNMDTLTSAAGRPIFQIDGAGNDVLSLQVATTGAVRFSVGDGAANVTVGSASVTPGVWLSVCAVTGPSGTFTVVDRVVSGSVANTYSGNASTTIHAGIGCQAAATGGAAPGESLAGRMRNLVVIPREISQAAAQAGPPFLS